MEGLGVKDDKTLLTPTVEGSETDPNYSLPRSAPNTSQDLNLHLNGSKEEPLSSFAVSSTKQGDSGTQMLPPKMGVTSTIPTESPLKRPYESSPISIPIEKRLERPINSTEDIPYSDTVATFAVDISGSTEGRVLGEEKETIKTLCGGLSRDASRYADIIPWNHDVQKLARADEIDNLTSVGGTEPSRLIVSPEARTALSKCSAWFLLTDGEISHRETRAFSQGICGTGLHGVPCVVILFGYKTARPVGCNISVGLSVFSNTADCLFLFHDIDTTQVYILQCKGVFNAVLPPDLHELALDARTLWNDVPLFKYRQLFDLPLPARQQLQSDELLLQSRRKINLQDLYTNQIDSSTAGEILSNNDNLQSVLLAAQVRGDDDNLRRWISEQSLGGQNILLRERPDIDRQAAIKMQAVLSLLARPIPDSETAAMQQDLRTAHCRNWVQFVSDLGVEYHERSARSTVVSGVMKRISSNRREMDSGCNSPTILSPVMSSTPQPEHTQYHSSDDEPQDLYRRTHRRTPFLRMPPGAPRLKNRVFNLLAVKSRLVGENAGALYIPHYQYQQGDSVVEGTCPICGEKDVMLVFLLKLPPTDISTPNFPQPKNRKGLAYPLAMGTYPETDILSSQLSCDSCAHALVQGNIEYDGDKITAAIPVMQSAFSGRYQSTTSKLVDTALEERFQKSSIELVFLSIIQGCLANLDGKNLELRSIALKKASCWITKQTRLPLCLSMSITANTAQSDPHRDPMQSIEVLEVNIRHIEQSESPLLQYPIGGFVVLMLVTRDLTQVTSVEACQLAVWQRFLFHLLERHCAFLANNQPQAIRALQEILTVSSTNTDSDSADDRHLKPVAEIPNDSTEQSKLQEEPRDVSMDSPISAESKVPSVQLTTVCGTHLLSEEDLEEFQRLEDLFEPVESLCSAALHSFLKCLSQQVETPSLAITLYDKMRAREDLHDIFVIPQKK